MTKVRARRLSDALFQAFLIVFAVLVALAVDEYWEHREERELGKLAVERLTTEIRDNRAELLSGRQTNRQLLDELGEALEKDAAGEALGITGVNYDVSLVGTDAWETARVTRAVHFIDFDRVSRISKVYRIQRLYQDRQDQVVSDIASIGGREQELAEVLGSIRGGLSITLEIGCNLLAEYDGLLSELSSLEILPPTDEAPSYDCKGDAMERVEGG